MVYLDHTSRWRKEWLDFVAICIYCITNLIANCEKQKADFGEISVTG